MVYEDVYPGGGTAHILDGTVASERLDISIEASAIDGAGEHHGNSSLVICIIARFLLP